MIIGPGGHSGQSGQRSDEAGVCWRFERKSCQRAEMKRAIVAGCTENAAARRKGEDLVDRIGVLPGHLGRLEIICKKSQNVDRGKNFVS